MVLKGVVAIVVLALALTAWHFQNVADFRRDSLRTSYSHESSVLVNVSRELYSTNESVQTFAPQYQAIIALEHERHDQVMSGTANLADLKSLVDREQTAIVDLNGTTTTLLASMRDLMSSIEAGGTNDDTRSLRSDLEDITSNLQSGEDSCATAARMIGDNLTRIENYGFFGLLNGNSSSDIQHSYDDCDESFATVAGKMPSFHDSAIRVANVYKAKLQNLRARYLAIRGPLDYFVKVEPLPEIQDSESNDNVSQGERQSATPQSVRTNKPDDIQSAAPPQVSDVFDAPLNSANVLPLLRATSALSVSTRSDGRVADVSVVDTPAHGMADSNNFTTGRLADGRWVGIVPLSSGGVQDVNYSLMWVWDNGQANFIGEIPAENDGLGHLTMTVHDGTIDLEWPVRAPGDNACCPTEFRKKILTVDGIRLRPLSDTTGRKK